MNELRNLIIGGVINYLRGLTWREALTTGADILIVYFVIYRVLKLIRGTRAAQMLVGVALLAALFFAAKRLELNTVSWLFENLINYFIILLIVIFQNDIQRGLIQVGQNLFKRRQYEETYVIEEVVQAADDLAKHRIGGLIVLERDADLADHLGEAGVELDARVTKELLETLFVPDADNHMHDGAVIIKNLRVQQAGALLPLSANAKLDKALGTRHRAAIGITEQTDAVVVVISEERGMVSLCFNGNIARDLAPATLRKALLGLFQKKTKGKAGARPVGRRASDLPGAADKARKDGRADGPGRADGHDGAGGQPGQGGRDGEGGRGGAGGQPAQGGEGGLSAQDRSRAAANAELLSLVVTQPLPRPADLPQALLEYTERTAPSSGSKGRRGAGEGLGATGLSLPPGVMLPAAGTGEGAAPGAGEGAAGAYGAAGLGLGRAESPPVAAERGRAEEERSDGAAGRGRSAAEAPEAAAILPPAAALPERDKSAASGAGGERN